MPTRLLPAAPLAAILAAILAASIATSCAPPRGLVLLDPALPVLDPPAARRYASFRTGIRRWMVREYPAAGYSSSLSGIAGDRHPESILLSPLLSSEHAAIRAAFPEAWILGTDLPEEGRTVSASWDPVPASREAGALAGAFLVKWGSGLPEPPEAVILSFREGAGRGKAAEAFLAGLASRAPAISARILALPELTGALEAGAVVRDLSGPGAKAVFLDAGSAGYRAARALHTARAGDVRGPRFLTVRTEYELETGLIPADLIVHRDSGLLLLALRAALEEGRPGSVAVQESLVGSGRGPD